MYGKMVENLVENLQQISENVFELNFDPIHMQHIY